MTSSGSVEPSAERIAFRCNICGRENSRPLADFGREQPSCDCCNSSVRARALMHILGREIFGADLALVDFPRVKAIRGIGLSDFCYDRQLAKKLDYRNTHYHKEPRFDIVNMASEHEGAYDFLISSEVFEHVAPPAETAFRNAWRALKPHGILLLTVPYTLDDKTVEHFPALDDYGLAQLHDRIVLVNRTREGQVQVFQDLCFHGGHGSTLEIRRFTERDLRALIAEAGFLSLQIYAENFPPFGILHAQNWSLPMAARKEPFSLSAVACGEVFEQWSSRQLRLRHLKRERDELKAEFAEYHAWATSALEKSEEELQKRTAWATGLKLQTDERTEWAMRLDEEIANSIAAHEKLKSEYDERTRWALSLKAEVDDLRQRLQILRQRAWLRVGRRLGLDL